MSHYKFTILGCGSSGGVPRLGNQWGACDPENKKNYRLRCSLLIEKFGPAGVTTILIDSGPDMRQQLLKAGTRTLDGVVYTHSHADHVNGIDDLRMIVLNLKKRLNVWADKKTEVRLVRCFDYAFKQLKGSNYPPILEINRIDKDEININGAGGIIKLQTLKVQHGMIDALGFRISNLAYIPDVSDIYGETWGKLNGLEVLIIDALRYRPHSSHTHVEKTLSWIETIKPLKAYLTNMHTDLDYEKLNSETPKHITPAYDGLTIESKY